VVQAVEAMLAMRDYQTLEAVEVVINKTLLLTCPEPQAVQALSFFVTPVLFNTLLVDRLLVPVTMLSIDLQLAALLPQQRQLRWLICLLIQQFSIHLAHGQPLLVQRKLNT
jgi:hypothetical protein